METRQNNRARADSAFLVVQDKRTRSEVDMTYRKRTKDSAVLTA